MMMQRTYNLAGSLGNHFNFIDSYLEKSIVHRRNERMLQNLELKSGDFEEDIILNPPERKQKEILVEFKKGGIRRPKIFLED